MGFPAAGNWSDLRASRKSNGSPPSPKSEQANFLIGVGGGKSIDIAKLASFNSKIPFVSVPTSASHDGISSPFGSVKGLDRPYSLVAKPPIAIVADTDLISRVSAQSSGERVRRPDIEKDRGEGLGTVPHQDGRILWQYTPQISRYFPPT